MIDPEQNLHTGGYYIQFQTNVVAYIFLPRFFACAACHDVLSVSFFCIVLLLLVDSQALSSHELQLCLHLSKAMAARMSGYQVHMPCNHILEDAGLQIKSCFFKTQSQGKNMSWQRKPVATSNPKEYTTNA